MKGGAVKNGSIPTLALAKAMEVPEKALKGKAVDLSARYVTSLF